MKNLFAVLFLSVFLLGCTTQQALPSATPSLELTATPIPTVDYAAKYPELAERIKAFKAEHISVRPDYLPPEVFAALPPFPKDLYPVRILVESNKLSINDLGPEYYTQPEFYPTFEDQGLPTYQNPPVGRRGVFGFGTYPSEYLVLLPQNGEAKASFILYNNWLGETWQGMKFYPYYPAEGNFIKNEFPDGTRKVMQDPDVVSKYFDVETTPGDVLLEPSFPVFQKGWAQKITVKLKSKNVPPGKYVIAFSITSPSQENSDKWYRKYLTTYVGGGGPFSLNVPYFSLFIHVT